MEDLELTRLVKEAIGGSEAALRSLIARTEKRLFRFLFLAGADEALAQDLVQDTLIYAFEHLAELENPAAFVGWLFRIGKHKLYDHRKSPRNSDSVPLESAPEPAAPGADLELILGVRQTLARLSEEERLTLVLIDMEGRSYAEAADIIGISEAAVTSRLRRARATFEEHYFSGK